MTDKKKILVTGGAGFIGYHVVKSMCDKGMEVVGVDNLNDYYDVRLKDWRLSQLKGYKNFSFVKCDIENRSDLEAVFSDHKIDAVVNLAARAGVGYSLENPYVYVTTNILGTVVLLELCRKYGVNKFVLASTSSLYAGKEVPFKEDAVTATPISSYAATKGGAEGLAYSYHHLFGIDISVLRYFTVYGPAGRPDMSYFKFIKWAMEDKPIRVNGDGSQSRDFTYVTDIADGTIKALKSVGYEIINLGGDKPHTLNDMVRCVGEILNKKVDVVNGPFLKEDMKSTWANIEKAKNILEWMPKIDFSEGMRNTVQWALSNKDLVEAINL